MTLAYAIGVAEPRLTIKENHDSIYDYRSKRNWVVDVTNSTAAFGL